MKVKLCGMRRMEDIRILNSAMPDYAGFILSKPYRRFVPLETLSQLCEVLDVRVRRVGVFVNETPEWILTFAPLLDVIQLHGEETAKDMEELRKYTNCEIWKAVRVRTAEDVKQAERMPADKLLLDSFSGETHGGTGILAPWEEIAKAGIQKPFFLAGGICAENLARAFQTVHPYGVDASSLLETDGFKDAEKIRQFMAAVRRVNCGKKE